MLPSFFLSLEKGTCLKERKKTHKPKRGMGEEDTQGPHLHEQDFGRTIRGTGGLSSAPEPSPEHVSRAIFVQDCFFFGFFVGVVGD